MDLPLSANATDVSGPRAFRADFPSRMTKEEFLVAVVGQADPETSHLLLMVHRCGCGFTHCSGWQLVLPGRPSIYPIPPEPSAKEA